MAVPTYDQSYFVELDNSNNVYLLGQTEVQDSTFIHNVLYFNYGSGQFVSKLSAQLDSVIYSTVFGNGNGISLSPTAFLVDLCNKMYLSGWGGGTNNFNTCNNTSFTTGMPVTFDAFQSTTDGSDHYIMVLEDDVSNIVYWILSLEALLLKNMLMVEQVDLIEKERCTKQCVRDVDLILICLSIQPMQYLQRITTVVI